MYAADTGAHACMVAALRGQAIIRPIAYIEDPVRL